MLRPHLEFLRQLRYHFFRLFHCNNHSSFLKTTASPTSRRTKPAAPSKRHRQPDKGKNGRKPVAEQVLF